MYLGKYVGKALKYAGPVLAGFLSLANLDSTNAQEARRVETVVVTNRDQLEAGKAVFDYLKGLGDEVVTYTENIREVRDSLRRLKPKKVAYIDTAERMAIHKIESYQDITNCPAVAINSLVSEIDDDPFPDADAGCIPVIKGDWDLVRRMIDGGDLEIRYVACEGGEGILNLALDGVGFNEARTIRVNGEEKVDPNGKVRKLVKKSGKPEQEKSYVDFGVKDLVDSLWTNPVDLFVWAGGHGNSAFLKGGWNYNDWNFVVGDGNKLYAVNPDNEGVEVRFTKPFAAFFPGSCEVGRIDDVNRSLPLAFIKSGAALYVGFPYSTWNGYAGFGRNDIMAFDEADLWKAVRETEIGLQLKQEQVAQWRRDNDVEQVGDFENALRIYRGTTIFYGWPGRGFRMVRDPAVTPPFVKEEPRKEHLEDGRTRYTFRVRKNGRGQISRDPTWILGEEIENVKDVTSSKNLPAFSIGDDFVNFQKVGEKLVPSFEKNEAPVKVDNPEIPDGTEWTLSFTARAKD